MERLANGFTLNIPEGAFPLSTDSMLLSDFVRLPRQARVLDLGSGCGTLGLLLCSRDENCHVTGVELSVDAHAAAVENITNNGLNPRMVSICGDIRSLRQALKPGSFDICLSNPPYFSGGPESRSLPDARKETCCTLEELMEISGKMLKYGRDLFLVHRPERLAQIISLGAVHQLEAKRLLLLRHRSDGPIILVLLQLRKGGKPGLRIEEAALFDSNGTPTDYYAAVYHLDPDRFSGHGAHTAPHTSH